MAHHRAVLRTALADAMREGILGRNVAALAKGPEIPEQEHDALSPAKARAIIAAVKGDRLETLYLLLLATGLREGEALGLTWEAVDLEAGSLRVRQVLQRVSREWRFLQPKTKRSRRTLPLASPLVAALRKHRAGQAEERLRLGPAWEGEQWGGLVFAGETGGPLYPDSILYHFHKRLAQAGIPRMRIHDLRHGAISMMAAMGVPPRVAMELAGHSVIATTMNTYAHIAPEYGEEAMDRVGAALWG